MKKFLRKFKHLTKIIGPGLTTGAADDDPSGIATYTQMGARYGFNMLWLAPFLYPFMSIVQEMCARIGLATGSGLATNIKKHYSTKVLFFVTLFLFIANVFNIGANLGAMAEVSRLIFPNLNFIFLIFFFAFFSLVLQVFIPYKKYSKYLKYLAFVLIAYILTAFFVNIAWGEVWYSLFNPKLSFNKETVLLICAAFGTTISPYLFFWQTDQEVEEKISAGEKTPEEIEKNTNKHDIFDMRVDTWFGMLASNTVMFFIILVAGATLHMNGIFNIETAADGAEALRPFAGEYAFLLFTLGILGTGLLSVPVLAGGASYAISEAFEWRHGLYRNFKDALSFYITLAFAILLGIGINFIGISPIKMLLYSAILNGIIAPIVLYFIVRIAGMDTMGKFKNNIWTNLFGYIIFILMAIIGITAIIFLAWN